MAGQRTRLRFGAVSADVLLEKASTKPRGAQHETRRVLVEQTAEALPDDAPRPEGTEVPVGASATLDPFGDPVDAPLDAAGIREHVAESSRARRDVPDEIRQVYAEAGGDPANLRGGATLHDDGSIEHDAGLAAEVEAGVHTMDTEDAAHDRARAAEQAPEYVPPATRVEQGVHLEDGTWVDLTDRLAEVDTRTRVDGLEVVRTIPSSSYASDRVREAHYVCGVDPDTYKVIALLWRALRAESMAAEVRWTKRTAQATGILLARGELPSAARPRPGVPAHLVLLELEWAANVKRVPPRARGPVTADVGVDEVASAIELVQSFAAPAPRTELRDERLAKRAELLDLAREERLGEYVPPAEPMPEDVAGDAEDLVAALALAAAWNRDHAPA